MIGCIYYIDKHEADLWPMFNWVSKIGLMSDKVEAVSSLEKYQFKVDEIYLPNSTHLQLQLLDFQFRLLYFNISLKDIDGRLKDVFIDEMNSYLKES